jgi:hypothetical protein
MKQSQLSVASHHPCHARETNFSIAVHTSWMVCARNGRDCCSIASAALVQWLLRIWLTLHQLPVGKMWLLFNQVLTVLWPIAQRRMMHSHVHSIQSGKGRHSLNDACHLAPRSISAAAAHPRVICQRYSAPGHEGTGTLLYMTVKTRYRRGSGPSSHYAWTLLQAFTCASLPWPPCKRCRGGH